MLASKVGGLAVVGFIAVFFFNRGRAFPGAPKRLEGVLLAVPVVIVITGMVLLLAASVDALSRQRSLSTGH